MGRIPFAKLRSKSISDIEKEYVWKDETVSNFVQENLPIVNKVIVEEGSRLHISLGNDDCVVSDYEDELSSLISCALAQMLNGEKRMPLTRSINGSLEKLLDKDQVSKQTVSSEDPPDILVTFGLADSHGQRKYSVVCLYSEDFCDLRKRYCYSELDYIDSLSRCEQWHAKDEKNKSVFAKSIDDRFIIKEIKRIEYESFVKFGPEYFEYLKSSYELSNQTCLAKVLGIYQVFYQNLLFYELIISNQHKTIPFKTNVYGHNCNNYFFMTFAGDYKATKGWEKDRTQLDGYGESQLWQRHFS